MATSGTNTGSSVTIGGGFSGNYIFTNWQLASQSVSGNYSTINWQTYFHFNSDDAELDSGSTGSNAGTLWSNGGRVYNFTGNYTTRDLGLSSGTFTIGHNSDGTQSLSISNSIAVYLSGTSSGTTNWSLPTIQRVSNFTSFSVSNISGTSFTINWSTDLPISTVYYSINSGSTYTNSGATSNTTSGSITVTGLSNGTNYGVEIYNTNYYSGIQTNSSVQNVTTKVGNNLVFMEVF